MVTKVLMLLSNEYRPDVRVEKEALALKGSGRQVRVLAWDREHHRASEEAVNGIGLSRVRTRPVHDKVRLAWNYPSFVLKLLKVGSRADCDVVHAHDLDTLLPGILISKLKDVPLIYDAHEHYAAMVTQNLPPALTPLIDLTERILIKNADRVIVVNHLIRDYLRPWVESEPVIVMNCIEPISIDVKRPDRAGLLLLYGGSLEPLRYIEEVIRTVKEMGSISLRVAGVGTLKAMVEEAARGDERIQYIGYLGHDQILREMAMADVIPIMVDPTNENNRIGTPIRLLESMALGIPVIVTKGTHSEEIVRETGCGLVIDYDIKAFQEALRQLMDPEVRRRMGENGIRAASKDYNWNVMKERLLELYSSLQ